MKIKTFNFPTFEEWKKRSFDRFDIKIGNYRAEIGVVSWATGKFEETYGFGVSLSNTAPLNLYTNKIFYKYFKFTGDTKSLKKWYENTISEFNDFWENYI